MSSYIMHICVSDIVKRRLNLTDKFVYGSVLPDVLKGVLLDRNGTHYIEKVVIDGDRRELPNIQRAIDELNIQDNEVRLGYIAHLVEDLIWFNNFIPLYAKDLGEDKIQFLQDNSMHSKEEYKQTMYADYGRSSEHVINKCEVDIHPLLENILKVTQDEQYQKQILDNTWYPLNADVSENIFMTKESIDNYIDVCTKEVERVVLELMGE